MFKRKWSVDAPQPMLKGLDQCSNGNDQCWCKSLLQPWRALWNSWISACEVRDQFDDRNDDRNDDRFPERLSIFLLPRCQFSLPLQLLHVGLVRHWDSAEKVLPSMEYWTQTKAYCNIFRLETGIHEMEAELKFKEHKLSQTVSQTVIN